MQARRAWSIDHLAAWWGRNRVLVVLLALSAVAHLWGLGWRPLAHDEAIDAWLSWQAGHGEVVRYDPVYHGPLRFYLEGVVLHLVGTGAFHARLVAALASVVATGLIATSTRLLGRVGAPVAAVLFIISPTALTVTRTGREDSLVALVSVALLLLVAHLLVEPRGWQVIAAGAVLAVSFGLKETTFLFGLAAFVFLAGAGIIAVLEPAGRCRQAARRLVELGSVPFVWSVIAFLAVFAMIFTSAFRYSEGFTSGLLDGVRYWWSQQDVRRGSQPWFFYLVVYAAYEWLTVALAAAGTLIAIRGRSLPGLWFVAMAAGQLALYLWAGERFAWLALHPLLPAFLLAGIGGQVVFERARTSARWWPALAIVMIAAALMTVVVAVRPAITDGADPRELLVTVQTSTDVPPIVERLREGVADGAIQSILIDDSGGASWPWAWYLHGIDDVAFATVDPQEIPTDYDAIVVIAGESPPIVPDGYEMERFRLRVWWLPDYGAAGLGDAARWFFARTAWTPTASFDEYLLLRR